MIFDFMMMQGVLCLFLEHVGADGAQGALEIGGELLALVNVTADGADELLHICNLLFIYIFDTDR